MLAVMCMASSRQCGTQREHRCLLRAGSSCLCSTAAPLLLSANSAFPCVKPRSPFQRGENEFYRSDVPQIKLSGPSGDSTLLNQVRRSLFLLVDFSIPTRSLHGEARCDFWNYLACNAGETTNLPYVICSRALPCNLLGFCMR